MKCQSLLTYRILSFQTDLCGIKWRRLVWDGIMNPGQSHPQSSLGPLDDPVLSSFARCLSADVLCVWRKSPNGRLACPGTPSGNDPFHPANNPPPPPPPPMHHQHHHGQNTGIMGPTSNYMQQMQSHHIPPNMMPIPPPHPHMNMMGPGHVGPHHMAGPSYPHHTNHIPHGMHPQQQTNAVNHPPFTSPPPPTLNGPKELWLFWYGEDPDLSTLVNPQLLKAGKQSIQISLGIGTLA